MFANSNRSQPSRLLLTVPAALFTLVLGTGAAQARLVNIEAGMISSAIEANVRCNSVANQNNGDWKGRWWTTPAQISYCQIEVADAPVVAPPPPVVIVHTGRPPRMSTQQVDAGIIWNSDQANQRCTVLARQMGGEWTGQWSTPASRSTSYCEIQAPDRRDHRSEHRGDRRSTVREVSAGPIRNDRHANRRCPRVAEDVHGEWTGQWRVTGPDTAAVCEVRLPVAKRPSKNGRVREISAGGIWDQNQAERKCPIIANSVSGNWTGDWRKTGPGNESVCSVEVGGRSNEYHPVNVQVDTTYIERTPPRPQNVREVNAGPIWDQNQASTKCPYIASTQNGVWTGKWRKLGPDHQSVCEVRFPG